MTSFNFDDFIELRDRLRKSYRSTIPLATPALGLLSMHRQKCSQRLLPLIQDHINQWSECTGCALSEHRTNMVFYRGQVPADVVFIADGPNGDSLNLGYPFAGDVEETFLAYIPDGCKYAVIYLTACGPASPPEIIACWDRVIQFISIAQPKIVCALGKAAESQYLRNMEDVISKLNRRPMYIRVNSPYYSIIAKDPDFEKRKAKLTIKTAMEKING